MSFNKESSFIFRLNDESDVDGGRESSLSKGSISFDEELIFEKMFFRFEEISEIFEVSVVEIVWMSIFFIVSMSK